MAYDVSTLLSVFDNAYNIYGPRNSDYSTLRDYFRAKYWEGSQARGIRLVYNKINEVVTSYVDAVSIPPDMFVIPPELSQAGFQVSNKLNFYLDYIWDFNKRIIRQQEGAFYQSLLGNAYMNVMPSANPKCWFKIRIPDPSFCYPVYSTDETEGYYGFFYAYRRSPKDIEARKALAKGERRDPEQPWYEDYNILEYWDSEGMCVIDLDTHKIETERKHFCGRVPWVSAPNLVIPATDVHQGDADQIVGLTEYLNHLISSSADAIDLYAYPPTIVEGQQISGDQMVGPGAQVNITKGSKVYYLTSNAPGPPIRYQQQMIMEAIHSQSRLGDLARAQRMPRETLGKTVKPLMWRTGNRVTTKEENMIYALMTLNEMILEMTEKLFKNKELLLQGVKGQALYAFKFKGADIQGLRRNVVKFKPLPWDEKEEALKPERPTERPGVPPPGIPAGEAGREEVTPRPPGPPGPTPPPAMGPEQVKLLFPGARGGSEKKIGTKEVTIYEVTESLQNIKKKFRGKVYIAGGIVSEGRTSRDIDVFVENMNDKGMFLNQFPKELRRWFHFTKIPKGYTPEAPAWLEIRGGKTKTFKNKDRKL